MANASDPVNAIADSNRNSRSKMRRLHNQASTPADSAETGWPTPGEPLAFAGSCRCTNATFGKQVKD